MSVASIPAKVRSSSTKNESESCLSAIVSQNIDDLKSLEMWRACFAEFVGTFLLTYFTIGVGISREGETPASLFQIGLGSGMVVACIITALSTVSGAHVNPAVSIGFLVCSHISFVRFVSYSVFQTLGAVVGALALQAVLPDGYEGGLGFLYPGPGVTDYQAVAMEMSITAFLLFGIMSFIDRYREDVKGSIPLMVGLVVFGNILTGGNVSGGAMNPARAFGPAAILGKMDKQWIYWVGPLTGGVVGALVYDMFLSTRPLLIITRGLDRTAPRPRPRPRRYDDNGDHAHQEMGDFSEETKLNPDGV